jgi:hypothetical protein
MAVNNQVPLNKFQTIPVTLGGQVKQLIYTCPPGVAAVVLFAQVSNVGEDNDNFSAYFLRNGVYTELLHEAPVPPHDAIRTIVGGRLILITDDAVAVTASSSNLKLVFSVLETATAN